MGKLFTNLTTAEGTLSEFLSTLTEKYLIY